MVIVSDLLETGFPGLHPLSVFPLTLMGFAPHGLSWWLFRNPPRKHWQRGCEEGVEVSWAQGAPRATRGGWALGWGHCLLVGGDSWENTHLLLQNLSPAAQRLGNWLSSLGETSPQGCGGCGSLVRCQKA